MSTPSVPAEIATALARYPAAVQARLLSCARWFLPWLQRPMALGHWLKRSNGEPAYLTEMTGSGTTIRLGVSKAEPDAAAMFVSCRTSLVDNFRAQFGDLFTYEGNRAVIVPTDGTLPEAPLATCMRAALLYHRRDRLTG